MIQSTARFLTGLSILAALVASPIVPAQVRQDLGKPVPQVLYSADPDYEHPRWVSAEAAIGPDGELNSQLFAPSVLRTWRINLETLEDVDGCLQFGNAYQDTIGLPDRSTLGRLMRHSDLVLHGRVVGKEAGLKGTVPGQLLRIEPIEFLRGAEGLDTYYVFFPVGTIQLGQWKICKTDTRYPAVPAVGDEMILAAPHRDDPQEQLLELDLAGPESYITLKSSGVVSLPRLLRESSQTSDLRRPGALLERLRSSLAEPGGRP